jgi:hypothetical protein
MPVEGCLHTRFRRRPGSSDRSPFLGSPIRRLARRSPTDREDVSESALVLISARQKSAISAATNLAADFVRRQMGRRRSHARAVVPTKVGRRPDLSRACGFVRHDYRAVAEDLAMSARQDAGTGVRLATCRGGSTALMPNGSRTAPRPVWLPSGSGADDRPNRSHHPPAGVVERGLFIVSAAAFCLVGLASRPDDVGRFPGLIVSSFAGLPEPASLLFFGSVLVGLGIWARRRSV